MSQAPSPSTNKPYGVARVLAVWNLARKIQVAEELEVSRHTLWRALSQEAAK